MYHIYNALNSVDMMFQCYKLINNWKLILWIELTNELINN